MKLSKKQLITRGKQIAKKLEKKPYRLESIAVPAYILYLHSEGLQPSANAEFVGSINGYFHILDRLEALEEKL